MISLGAAVSLAVVTGIVNPFEKVNALWIVIAAACVFVLSDRVRSIRNVISCIDKKYNLLCCSGAEEEGILRRCATDRAQIAS
jgi:hypothetical protein